MTHPLSQDELEAITKDLKSFTVIKDKNEMCELYVAHVSRLLDEVERLRDNLHQFKFSYEEAWIKQEGELASLRSMLGRAVDWAKMVTGFCVAFREDKPCWNEHQDVGVLYAKTSTLLTNLTKTGDGGSGDKTKDGE